MSYPPPYDPNQAQPPQYGAPVPPNFPPAYGQPVPPPVKKSGRTGLVIGIILGVLLLVCVVCGGGALWFINKANDKITEIENTLPSFGVSTGSPGSTGPHTVRFAIEGSGEALITWSRGTSGTDSDTVTLPWTKEITVDRDTFGVSLIAFGRGDGTKVDGCSIAVDGKELKKSAGSGLSAVCTAVFVG